jgi:hypothetical protein
MACAGRCASAVRRDELLQLFQPRRSDPRNGVELLHGSERTVLLPVVEDLLRRHGPDTRERIELLERGGVQMHRPARRAGCARARRDRRPASRNDDLLTVGDRSREVDELDLCLRRDAACARECVRDARPARQAIEPRATNGPDDVHDEQLRRRRRCRGGGRDGRRCGGLRSEEEATSQDEHDEDRDGGDRDLASTERKVAQHLRWWRRKPYVSVTTLCRKFGTLWV